MALSEIYRRQVALLIRILPHVSEEDCFALKGGTAINLFIRDMPRLSVDIDLTFVPVAPRDVSLRAIDAALKRIASRIRKTLRGAQVVTPAAETTKLLVRHDSTQVKIEVTPVLRGCVYEPVLRSVSSSVEDSFGFVEIKVVSFADLYAGKIVAALDRQHPRDLFDVRDLLANEGMDDDLRRAFIVYLISHNRPISEILAPIRKPLGAEFSRGFAGMSTSSVLVEELEAAREDLIAAAVGGMSESHRRFLISFKRGQPEWSLLDVPSVIELPAVQWRQRNLDQLAPAKRAKLIAKLEEVLRPAKARRGSSA